MRKNWDNVEVLNKFFKNNPKVQNNAFITEYIFTLDIEWIYKYEFHFCSDFSSPNPVELSVELETAQSLNYP